MKKELESLKESPTGVEVPGVGKTSGMSDARCFPVCLSHHKQDSIPNSYQRKTSGNFHSHTYDRLIYDSVREEVCLKTILRQIVTDKG